MPSRQVRYSCRSCSVTAPAFQVANQSSTATSGCPPRYPHPSASGFHHHSFDPQKPAVSHFRPIEIYPLATQRPSRLHEHRLSTYIVLGHHLKHNRVKSISVPIVLSVTGAVFHGSRRHLSVYHLPHGRPIVTGRCTPRLLSLSSTTIENSSFPRPPMSEKSRLHKFPIYISRIRILPFPTLT